MTVHIELGDFCEIAAEILGTTPEQIVRLPRIALADSALAAPGSGFGDEDTYPELLQKAAVLSTRLGAENVRRMLRQLVKRTNEKRGAEGKMLLPHVTPYTLHGPSPRRASGQARASLGDGPDRPRGLADDRGGLRERQ